VRLARVATGREEVLGCATMAGSTGAGRNGRSSAGVRALFAELPFNDVATSRQMIPRAGHRLAAVVIEPLSSSSPHANGSSCCAPRQRGPARC